MFLGNNETLTTRNRINLMRILNCINEEVFVILYSVCVLSNILNCYLFLYFFKLRLFCCIKNKKNLVLEIHTCTLYLRLNKGYESNYCID